MMSLNFLVTTFFLPFVFITRFWPFTIGVSSQFSQSLTADRQSDPPTKRPTKRSSRAAKNLFSTVLASLIRLFQISGAIKNYNGTMVKVANIQQQKKKKKVLAVT